MYAGLPGASREQRRARRRYSRQDRGFGETSARTAYLLEIDPRFVDVAVRRWEQFTNRSAVLEETGETFADVRTKRAEEAA